VQGNVSAKLTILPAETDYRRPPGPLRQPWPEFRDWLFETFELGEHISVLAPTGGGKTHFIRKGLSPLFEDTAHPKNSTPVLIIDAKDNDPLMEGFGRPVQRLPGKLERWLGGDPKPWFRLRIPSRFRGYDASEVQRSVYAALARFFRMGDCAIICDELRPILRLRLEDYLVDIWERGRSEGVTLVGGTQAPRFMPSHLYDAPSYTFLGRVTDQRVRIRFREIGGYSDELGQAIARLRRHEFAHVSGQHDAQSIFKVSKTGA
jgi:hypothetical protein